MFIEKFNIKIRNIYKKGKPFIKKHSAILFCVLLFFLYSAFFLFSNVSKMTDNAFFGGDTWEYQSMGVNFAMGHGLKIGGIEKFKSYKFKETKNIEDPAVFPNKQGFMEGGKNGGSYRFYRAPVYPFFLGLVYKIFGVHPGVVKIIQLLILAVIAASLPMLGFYYWGKRGYASGVIAGSIFMYKYSSISTELMTEVLIISNIFLVLFAFNYLERKKSPFSFLLLGLSLSFLFLNKGSLWFIPFLFLGYILLEYFKHKIQKKAYFVILIIAFLIPIILYSTFATIKNGKFVLVTTQGDIVLLDGNNEASIKSGSWQPEGTMNPNGFYEKNKNLSTTNKLISFYKEHSKDIPKAIFNKIRAGFKDLGYLFTALFFVSAEIVFLFFKKRGRSRKYSIIAGVISMLLSIAFAYYLQIPFLIFYVTLLMIVAIFSKINIFNNLPITFILFFINFFLITIIIFGYLRFTMVIDIFFILLTVNYLLIVITWFMDFFPINLKTIKKNSTTEIIISISNKNFS